MATGSEAQDVIAKFHGTYCDGQEMRINEARPMQKRSFTGGRIKKAW